MDAQTLAFLEAVTAHPTAEREWLDMLSQLEYVGCRKILRGVPFEKVNCEVLQHISEEASHALLLKRLGNPTRSWEQGLFARAGWAYFQTLDAEISTLDLQGSHPYHAVSFTIEERVLQLYPAYRAQTTHSAVKRALSIILAQEERHGKVFGEIPFSQPLREKMRAIESRLWENLIVTLTTLLAPRETSACFSQATL